MPISADGRCVSDPGGCRSQLRSVRPVVSAMPWSWGFVGIATTVGRRRGHRIPLRSA
jgi:hypothetical protein